MNLTESTPMDEVTRRAKEAADEIAARENAVCRVRELQERLDRAEMALALVRGYAVLLRSCAGGDSDRDFAVRVANEIDSRTANAPVTELRDAVRALVRFRELVGLYASGDVRMPWACVRDELASVCEKLDQAKLS